MLILYNILQLFLLPFLILLLPFYFLLRPEKLGVILPRLGFGLASVTPRNRGNPTIWIHALSVGEVTSALPLTRAIREEYPHCTLIFTATTRSGHDLAERLTGPYVDTLLFFPFDILPTVNHYIKRLQPDLCIIVETDFWPNFLAGLSAGKIPAVLVNGRVSAQSRQAYQRFPSFFKRVFNRFQFLCMQSEQDTRGMLQLGVEPGRLRTIGNLKYAEAHPVVSQAPGKGEIALMPDESLFLCGSTHAGEEQIIIDVYKKMRQQGHALRCAIAPRAIKRADDIVALAETENLSTARFSRAPTEPVELIVIDTIGDLASLYYSADIAFIGGSLVPQGGHNPLEAVRASCPVMFGPHMDDFSEIRASILEAGCGFEVKEYDDLYRVLNELLGSPGARQAASDRARRFIGQHEDVIAEHINLIKQCM
jgi:3-deoxy-D-manno-octulosonic-acid transferase